MHDGFTPNSSKQHRTSGVTDVWAAGESTLHLAYIFVLFFRGCCFSAIFAVFSDDLVLA